MPKTVAIINSLACDRILEDILLLAVQGGHEEAEVVGSFLRMIELASVCRQWRFHLTAHICRTAIVEYKRMPYQNTGTSSSPSCRWVSNINFITAMGLSSRTEELYISDIDGKGTPSFLTAMEALQFGSYAWDRVTTLKLGRFAFKDTETGSPGVIDSVFSLLTSTLPSVSHVDYPLDGPPGTYGITLRAMLINYYTANSKTVYIREWYLTASLGLLRHDITKLDINTSFVFGAPRDLRLPNAALRCLRLTDAGRGFQWNWFRDGADGQRIVFPELMELTLEFVYIGDEMGTKSFAGFGLNFPKLQKLCTLDALLYYSDFYTTFIDSPLESLYIAEMKAHLEFVDPRVIRGVRVLSICPTEGPPAPLYLENPYDNLLPADSMVRAATLVSIPSYMLPEINWTNLWNLRLNLNKLEFEPIDSLLSRLPFLKSLSIGYYICSWLAVRDYHPRCASCDLLLEPLSMSLQSVSIDIDDKRTYPVCAKWICNLVLHTPSLLKVCVPSACVNEIRKFADSFGKVISVSKATSY